MNKTITGVFNGVAIVPDRPVKLPVGKRLRLKIELAPIKNGKKNGKPAKIKITGAGKFHSGVPDLAMNKKHLQGLGKKRPKPITFLGTGEFASGVGDLSTNKKHMEGFGKS